LLCFLGDTFDILALINNSVNFILYCLMSRAFRDTFKQTFCFVCQKADRRESSISFAQLSATKSRQTHINQSIAYDNVSSRKCSDEYRSSSTPVENIKKKKSSKTLEVFNHPITIPLLNNEKNTNGLTKNNSDSS
jgi:hypothetical protein